MAGQLADLSSNARLQVGQCLLQLGRFHQLRDAMMGGRLHALSQHDHDPAVDPEQFVTRLIGGRIVRNRRMRSARLAGISMSRQRRQKAESSRSVSL